MSKKKQETPLPKKDGRGASARRKGHAAERSIASELRELGWSHAATTRATSRQLDNAKVDVNFVPFNIQSKAVKQDLKFSDYVKLLDEVKQGLLSLPPELLYRLAYPSMIFHKKDRETLVVMRKHDFYHLLTHYHLNKTNTNTDVQSK